MGAKPYLFVSAVVFGLVAVLHLTRIVMGWPAQLGEQAIPMAVSWAGVIGAGALSLWGFGTAITAASTQKGI